MKPTHAATAFVIAIGGSPTWAQVSETNVEALYEALSLEEIINVMRIEGLDYGETIGMDLFGRQVDQSWAELVDEIYNPNRMQTVLLDGLSAELAGDDVDTMVSFFTSEPGLSIIELEVAARQAFLDEAVEEAANEIAALAVADETPRYQLVTDYIEANDLIEANIAGAMNSNFAFLKGMLDGGGMQGEMTEEEILRGIWAQEPEIRQNTTEWVYSFLLLAYEPLSDADLEAYIAFSQSDAGQQLNFALFSAFDGMLDQISRGMGLASAQMMGQSDL